MSIHVTHSIYPGSYQYCMELSLMVILCKFFHHEMVHSQTLNESWYLSHMFLYKSSKIPKDPMYSPLKGQVVLDQPWAWPTQRSWSNRTYFLTNQLVSWSNSYNDKLVCWSNISCNYIFPAKERQRWASVWGKKVDNNAKIRQAWLLSQIRNVSTTFYNHIFISPHFKYLVESFIKFVRK